MCGIWGGFGYHSLAESQIFSRLLSHRGPDHQGAAQVCTNKYGNRVWFGHTRLSVIDTRAVANQPMWSVDKRICLVFNGEIYNFKELRKQFCSDYPFVSDSDTEVILALWQQMGTSCLKVLRGIFAFALFDVSSETMYLCRDPLGVKPLYYVTSTTGAFAFSSEASVLAAMGMGSGIRREACTEYFYHRYVPGDETIFAGIKRVPPASYIKVSSTAQIDGERYWSFPGAKDRISLHNAETELDSLLHEAVRSQLVADVPLGIFLSGGLDSSVIAALAVKMLDKTVDTFSVGFDDPICDETSASELVASYLGTQHHKLIFSGSLKNWLPKIIQRFDEPIADPAMLPMYVLSDLARSKVVVALSGDGADELFAGYKQYRLEPLVPWLRKIKPVLRAIFQIYGWNERRDRLMRVLDSLEHDYWPEWTGALSLEVSSALTGIQGARMSPRNISLADRLLEDLQSPLVDRMLMKVDKMSMAHSLEVRVPFLDPNLVDFVCRLDTKLKVKLWGDKLILRKVAKKYLPISIVKRQKHGFNLPISAWLRNADADFCKDILLDSNCPLSNLLDMTLVKKIVNEHLNKQGDHGVAIYSLLVLSLWLTDFSKHKQSAI